MCAKPATATPVWDPLVRLCHWLTVALVLANYLWLEDELHEWAGYLLALTLAVRLLWGVVGSANARFASFWPTPTRLRLYLRQQLPQALRRQPQAVAHSSHNPLGALMVLTLLALLLTVCISGWLQTTDRYWGEEWVALLHQYSVNLLLGCAAIHVLAVVIMQRLTGIPLIRAMVRGRR